MILSWLYSQVPSWTQKSQKAHNTLSNALHTRLILVKHQCLLSSSPILIFQLANLSTKLKEGAEYYKAWQEDCLSPGIWGINTMVKPPCTSFSPISWVPTKTHVWTGLRSLRLVHICANFQFLYKNLWIHYCELFAFTNESCIFIQSLTCDYSDQCLEHAMQKSYCDICHLYRGNVSAANKSTWYHGGCVYLEKVEW